MGSPDQERLSNLESKVGHMDNELGRLGQCMETLTENQQMLIQGVMEIKALQVQGDRNSDDIQALFKLHRDSTHKSSFREVVTTWAPILISLCTVLGVTVKFSQGG